MNLLRSVIFYIGYFAAMLVCGLLFLPPAPLLRPVVLAPRLLLLEAAAVVVS